MAVAVKKTPLGLLLNAARLPTPIGVRMMLVEFGVASISAEMSLWHLCEFTCVVKAYNNRKHEISPSTDLIWTVPTRQPRLRSIRGRRNALGGPCDHYRKRTGGRRLRRCTGDFF